MLPFDIIKSTQMISWKLTSCRMLLSKTLHSSNRSFFSPTSTSANDLWLINWKISCTKSLYDPHNYQQPINASLAVWPLILLVLICTSTRSTRSQKICRVNDFLVFWLRVENSRFFTISSKQCNWSPPSSCSFHCTSLRELLNDHYLKGPVSTKSTNRSTHHADR